MERDKNSRPVVELKNLENTAIRTSTEEEFIQLVNIYKSTHHYEKNERLKGRNFWFSGIWQRLGSLTCATIDIEREGINFGNEGYYTHNGFSIISLEEFCSIQGLDYHTLKEINEFHRPGEDITSLIKQRGIFGGISKLLYD